MYFTRPYNDANDELRGRIFVTKRATRADPWDEPIELDLLGDGIDNEADPELSADGLELYFTKVDQAAQTAQLYVAKREAIDSPWGEPVSLGPTVNDGGCQVTPRISSDGLVLVFALVGLLAPTRRLRR